MGACCCCIRSVGQNDYNLGFFGGRYCFPGCHRCGGGMVCAPRAEEQDSSSVQDVRYVPTAHDGLIIRHDKSGPAQSGESELARVATGATEGDVGTTFENSKIAGNKSQLGDCKPGSPGKCQPSKLSEPIVPFADEDDVCPTCLEEYDDENPRIITKCEHHFHLACILEWMERSDTCPICDQEMVFNETP